MAVGVSTGTGSGPPRPVPVPFDTPLYDAGIDSGDTIKTIDGQPATMAAWNAIANRKPGEQVTLGVVRRGGAVANRIITLKQDPLARQAVPVESQPGANLTAAQKAFRDNWLATRVQ